MKKLASFALAFALCAACAAPVLAEETKTTIITTSINPTYTVDIPANTAIAFNAASTTFDTKLGLSKAQLDPGSKVTVTAKPTALKNDTDSSKTIPFTLCKDDGTAFTSADFTNTSDKVELSVHIDQTAWNKAYAGNYTGSVTFEISYK